MFVARDFPRRANSTRNSGSPVSVTSRSPARGDFTVVAALLLAVATALWLFAWWEPVPTGADAPGYYVPARMQATGSSTILVPTSPVQYVGGHWLDAGDGRFVSRYPPGVPFLASLLYRAGGAEVAPALNLLLAALLVFLVVVWARRLVALWAALAAGTIFASLAAFAEQSLLGFSHLPTATALLAAVLFADRWHDGARRSDAFLAGLFAGLLPALRYPEALLTLVIGLWALLHVRSARHARTLPVMIAGALVPVALVLAYNTRLFGSPLATGYALTGEAGGFGAGYLARHAVPYLTTLARNLGPSMLAGGVGMLLLWRREGTTGRGSLLAALVASMTVAYMAFFWPFADVRFLLPTLPLWVVAGVWLATQTSTQRRARLLVAALLGAHAVIFAADSLPRTRRIARFADRMRLTSDAVRRTVPPGSVVIAPGPFQSLMEYRGDWKLAEWTLLWTGPLPPRPTGVPSARTNDGKLQPSPDQRGKGATLRRKYEGLDEGARVRAALDDAFAWAGGAPVVWIGDDRWTSSAGALVAPGYRLERLASIEAGGDSTPPAAWWLPSLPVGVFRVVPANGAPGAR